MGFQDKTLLSLLLQLAGDAVQEFMQWPEILMLDIMCNLHKMAMCKQSADLTPAEIWNALMEPVRQHLHRPGNATRIVWMSVDKRHVSVLKKRTTDERDARATEAKVGAAGDVGLLGSPPYPPLTQVDEYGRVFFVERISTAKDAQPVYQISGWPEGNKLNLRRLCASRDLRYKVFLYIFTKIAPQESRNLPKGTKLIISFSDNADVSPVIVESSEDRTAPGHNPIDRTRLWNSWSEADHDMPYGLAALLSLEFERERAYRPISVLSCSVDGDFYGIWSTFLAHPKNSVWRRAGLTLSHFNMNPIYKGPNWKVVEMNRFLHNLETRHQMSADALALFMYLSGNDYTQKQLLTPRLSAEKAWPRLVQCVHESKTSPQVISDAVRDVSALSGLIRKLSYNKENGKNDKAVFQAASNKDALSAQLDFIRAGLRLWGTCFSQKGPLPGDTLLQPVAARLEEL